MKIKIVEGGTYQFHLPSYELELVTHEDKKGFYAIRIQHGNYIFSEQDLSYLKKCKDNDGRLIVDGRTESTIHIRNFIQRYSEIILDAVNNDSNKIFAISGSYKIQYLNDIELKYGFKSVYPFSFFNIVQMGVYFSSYAGYYKDASLSYHSKILDQNNKTKDFVCLNRRSREHRVHLIDKLIDNNLEENNYVSFFIDHEWFPESNIECKKIIEKIKTKYPNNLTIDIQNSDRNPAIHMNWNWYINSRFSLVSETMFYTTDVFFSEKTFKPIVAKHPFIMVNAPRTLAALKEIGFKTFSKWFDESYDEEFDHDKRLEMIVTEVKRISNLSINEKNKMFSEMKDVLDHNYNLAYGGNVDDFINYHSTLSEYFE